MKKYLSLFFGAWLCSMPVFACDLCSIYLNLEPNDLKNSIGMNYRYRAFKYQSINRFSSITNLKHATGENILSESSTQEELFNSYDLWVNYFLHEKWQLNATLTFADNYYLEDDSTLYNIAGPGDLTVLSKYMFYNTKVTDSSDWAVRILGGVGIQIPIGQFNKTYVVAPSSSAKGNVVFGAPYEELDPHMQAGTGSWDFIFTMEAQIRYKKVGLASNLSYQVNSENSNQFRFANRFNLNSNAFVLLNLKPFTFAPNIGLSYEFSERDRFQGERFYNSGGEALFLNGGAKTYYKDFALGATYFKPISQSLNDRQLPNDYRYTLDLTYYF